MNDVIDNVDLLNNKIELTAYEYDIFIVWFDLVNFMSLNAMLNYNSLDIIFKKTTQMPRYIFMITNIKYASNKDIIRN